MTCLRLILGDQLSHDVSSLADVQPGDVVVMVEVADEAEHVPHHAQKSRCSCAPPPGPGPAAGHTLPPRLKHSRPAAGHTGAPKAGARRARASGF